VDDQERNPDPDWEPQACTGADAAHHASHLGRFQSGFGAVDGSPDYFGCEEGSRSQGAPEESVSGGLHSLTNLELMAARRFVALRNVHPAETFPLVLATGAVIQQIIFVAVQSASLSSVLSNQCRGLAMITLPGAYTHILRPFRD
jgi:hypothetical protein